MELILLSKAAQQLNIGRRLMNELVNSGRLRIITIGNRRFTTAEWMKSIRPDQPEQVLGVNLRDSGEFYAAQRKKWLKTKRN